MNTPHDQSQRDRFIHELERNFSVVASAGSGKTRAITDRIVALAQHPRAAEWLPSLVVVTYTNRAAAEMQQRARQSILEAGVKLEVINAFNRAFFGTIHSLCLKLLRQHGHYLGLPAQLEHLNEDDDAALWTEFVQSSTAIGAGLDPEQRRALLRLTPARRLLDLGRRGHITEAVPAPGPFPKFDFEPIYAFVPKKVSQVTAARVQEAMRRWETAWEGDDFVGALPGCKCAPLKPIWEAAIVPIVEWRRCAALHVAAEISQAYREFRLGRGVMTFSDQIALAAELLRHPEAAQRIRAKQYRVILDEAQDTDPTQFDVLLEVARPVEATGPWPSEETHPPLPGHFCMVGDFQQSIYGARADLAHYRRVHQAFLRTGAGEEVIFSVTFRLDRAGIEFANAVFPIVLHGLERQVPYVALYPRPTAFPGQIVRFDPKAGPEIIAERALKNKEYWEANNLAHWLREVGLEKLRASSWREVALLCPRTRWLPPLRAALRSVGLKAQVQSERSINGDSPAYAWFTALATVLAEPRNGFEIVGVLREIFGLSDHDLAAFSEGYGVRFHLTAPTGRGGPVAEKINLLVALREQARSLPLFSAMEEMVRVTQLRDRLLSLPADEYEGLGFELEELLTKAATAEAAKGTLENFAAELQSEFHAARNVRGALPDAIQIISGHKSKGSEWEAVIIPFFARGAKTQSPVYPRLLRDPRSAATIAAMESSDVDGDLKTAVALQEQQELERLLYVALTRAKHTLVLVDDRALFTGKKGLPERSQASRLRCGQGEENAAAFERLPTKLSACTETAEHHAQKAIVRSQEMILPLPTLPAKALKASRERAAVFLKRNPSALAEAALAEADPAAYVAAARQASSAPNAGQRYGTWWHNFVEVLDWSAPVASWDRTFETHLAGSPDPDRSHHDWALLRTQLTSDSDLTRLLAGPGTLAHAEMPFLWAMSERECLDGIIDLAVYDRQAHRWTILDWKTNRVPPSRSHYLPQLSAYWKAASEMLHTPVAAGLYITATGQWLPYEESELAGAWDALSRNSAALTEALEDDRGD
ncbi:UvrD/REP helicase [Chthoniobacter flavus Ellin428]|uniref:DNA 3'-5' helicase n=1 Tax=Chthoniobacter flavus Ellin428 TaxID=497964 RepID=B4CW83_9BACT|nr:UvrD-helicase domain-containing protein [Chthoniobacter flavus]EDY21675.1 UvrD/REP helicase [Chthoniobacter flavus Ellin428]TCO95613.1 ATP-dependent exoDNAse (exonuclease V) beta subunit [Chthoniobacter flavus]